MPSGDDIFGIVVIVPAGWLICWYFCRQLARQGVQLRHRRVAFIATAGAVATAALHIWAMRGLRGHPYEWLADPVVGALALQPIIYTLCAVHVHAGLGSGVMSPAADGRLEPRRSRGVLWRRAVEQGAASDGE